MAEWFETLNSSEWLGSDDGGESEAKFVAKALSLRPQDRVLDAPCGAGRILRPLARAGFSVVGVDLKRSFIDRARRGLRRDGVIASLSVMDLRQIDFHDEFDAIVNWNNSFGYFTDPENADVMARFARALKAGGRILIDTFNRERVLRRFRSESTRERVIHKSTWDAVTQRLEIVRMADGYSDQEKRSSQRWYTPAQLRYLMRDAGLETESVYGSSDGESFNRGSRQAIFVARKIERF